MHTYEEYEQRSPIHNGGFIYETKSIVLLCLLAALSSCLLVYYAGSAIQSAESAVAGFMALHWNRLSLGFFLLWFMGTLLLLTHTVVQSKRSQLICTTKEVLSTLGKKSWRLCLLLCSIYAYGFLYTYMLMLLLKVKQYYNPASMVYVYGTIAFLLTTALIGSFFRYSPFFSKQNHCKDIFLNAENFALYHCACVIVLVMLLYGKNLFFT